MSFVLLSKVAKQRERSTPKKYTHKKYTLDTPAAESHSAMTAKRTFLCTKLGTLDWQHSKPSQILYVLLNQSDLHIAATFLFSISIPWPRNIGGSRAAWGPRLPSPLVCLKIEKNGQNHEKERNVFLRAGSSLTLGLDPPLYNTVYQFVNNLPHKRRTNLWQTELFR